MQSWVESQDSLEMRPEKELLLRQLTNKEMIMINQPYFSEKFLN